MAVQEISCKSPQGRLAGIAHAVPLRALPRPSRAGQFRKFPASRPGVARRQSPIRRHSELCRGRAGRGSSGNFLQVNPGPQGGNRPRGATPSLSRPRRAGPFRKFPASCPPGPQGGNRPRGATPSFAVAEPSGAVQEIPCKSPRGLTAVIATRRHSGLCRGRAGRGSSGNFLQVALGSHGGNHQYGATPSFAVAAPGGAVQEISCKSTRGLRAAIARAAPLRACRGRAGRGRSGNFLQVAPRGLRAAIARAAPLRALPWPSHPGLFRKFPASRPGASRR